MQRVVRSASLLGATQRASSLSRSTAVPSIAVSPSSFSSLLTFNASTCSPVALSQSRGMARAVRASIDNLDFEENRIMNDAHLGSGLVRRIKATGLKLPNPRDNYHTKPSVARRERIAKESFQAEKRERYKLLNYINALRSFSRS